jgi:D-sedoheptulose 7-phosphate isomerase
MNKDKKLLESFISEIKFNFESVPKTQFINIKKIIKKTKNNKKKLIVIGNGGSSSIASHFSVDMTKNAKIKTINFNEPNMITCFSNDYGFNNWIKKALEYHADKGDVLFAISSSGSSKNIINAAKFFKKKFGKVVTLTGMMKNNPLKKIGDINLWINSYSYNIIESIHTIYLLMIVDTIIGKTKYKSNL